MNIIFDLDGTLWDSTQTILKAWKDIFSINNILNITDDDIKSILGLTEKNIVTWLIDRYNLEEREAADILKKCQNHELKFISQYGGILYKGVQQTLSELSKKYNMYIVSNCQSGYIEAFLKFYKFSKYFKDFECAGNTKAEKSVNIMNVMKRNNIKRAIFIGDTQGDFKAANDNNLIFAYASYGFGDVKDYDYILYSFTDLKDLCYNLSERI